MPYSLSLCAHHISLQTRCNYAFADKVYSRGIARRAAPLDRLQARYREFQRRMYRKWIDSQKAASADSKLASAAINGAGMRSTSAAALPFPTAANSSRGKQLPEPSQFDFERDFSMTVDLEALSLAAKGGTAAQPANNGAVAHQTGMVAGDENGAKERVALGRITSHAAARVHRETSHGDDNMYAANDDEMHAIAAGTIAPPPGHAHRHPTAALVPGRSAASAAVAPGLSLQRSSSPPPVLIVPKRDAKDSNAVIPIFVEDQFEPTAAATASISSAPVSSAGAAVRSFGAPIAVPGGAGAIGGGRPAFAAQQQTGTSGVGFQPFSDELGQQVPAAKQQSAAAVAAAVPIPTALRQQPTSSAAVSGGTGKAGGLAVWQDIGTEAGRRKENTQAATKWSEGPLVQHAGTRQFTAPNPATDGPREADSGRIPIFVDESLLETGAASDAAAPIQQRAAVPIPMRAPTAPLALPTAQRPAAASVAASAGVGPGPRAATASIPAVAALTSTAAAGVALSSLSSTSRLPADAVDSIEELRAAAWLAKRPAVAADIERSRIRSLRLANLPAASQQQQHAQPSRHVVAASTLMPPPPPKQVGSRPLQATAAASLAALQPSMQPVPLPRAVHPDDTACAATALAFLDDPTVRRVSISGNGGGNGDIGYAGYAAPAAAPVAVHQRQQQTKGFAVFADSPQKQQQQQSAIIGGRQPAQVLIPPKPSTATASSVVGSYGVDATGGSGGGDKTARPSMLNALFADQSDEASRSSRSATPPLPAQTGAAELYHDLPAAPAPSAAAQVHQQQYEQQLQQPHQHHRQPLHVFSPERPAAGSAAAINGSNRFAFPDDLSCIEAPPDATAAFAMHTMMHAPPFSAQQQQQQPLPPKPAAQAAVPIPGQRMQQQQPSAPPVPIPSASATPVHPHQHSQQQQQAKPVAVAVFSDFDAEEEPFGSASSSASSLAATGNNANGTSNFQGGRPAPKRAALSALEPPKPVEPAPSTSSGMAGTNSENQAPQPSVSSTAGVGPSASSSQQQHHQPRSLFKSVPRSIPGGTAGAPSLLFAPITSSGPAHPSSMSSSSSAASSSALAAADGRDMTINTRLAMEDMGDIFGSAPAQAPVAQHHQQQQQQQQHVQQQYRAFGAPAPIAPPQAAARPQPFQPSVAAVPASAPAVPIPAPQQVQQQQQYVQVQQQAERRPLAPAPMPVAAPDSPPLPVHTQPSIFATGVNAGVPVPGAGRQGRALPPDARRLSMAFGGAKRRESMAMAAKAAMAAAASGTAGTKQSAAASVPAPAPVPIASRPAVSGAAPSQQGGSAFGGSALGAGFTIFEESSSCGNDTTGSSSASTCTTTASVPMLAGSRPAGAGYAYGPAQQQPGKPSFALFSDS